MAIRMATSSVDLVPQKCMNDDNDEDDDTFSVTINTMEDKKQMKGRSKSLADGVSNKGKKKTDKPKTKLQRFLQQLRGLIRDKSKNCSKAENVVGKNHDYNYCASGGEKTVDKNQINLKRGSKSQKPDESNPSKLKPSHQSTPVLFLKV